MSYSLGSDNHSGVHPRILQSLQEANHEHAHSYGMDALSVATLKEWKRLFGQEVDVHYVFNGTAANVLCLQTLVRPYEAIVASAIAHLQMDECGAPEKHIGAKIYTLPSEDGKIHPSQMADYVSRGGDQHFAQPRAISLTLPTEMGVCYTLDELAAWRDCADKHSMYIHWDGSRFANAVSFLKQPMAELVRIGRPDAISFGGTKNGLLGAEAVVFFNSELAKNFRYIRKQGMQLPSKTRFLAAQFNAYLSNDLWREIAEHVNSEARFLAGALGQFEEIRIVHPVESNALFVQLPKSWIDPLKQSFFFYIWDNENRIARWMISFDWNRKFTDRLIQKIHEVKKQCPV